ncbi:MAG: hypothetical protein WD883_01150 [Candidatus Colwellbacteria bacterium]
MKNLVVKTSLLLSGLLPSAAFAQDTFDPRNPGNDAPELPDGAPTDFETLIEVIVTIARWMFGILMALGIVFVLYAAFLYLVAQGDDTRITTAKKVLIYSIVALVIGVLAGGISVVVQDFVQGAA